MKNILLVEPTYKNKYPPLGLMKLSTYHKLKGDYVRFVKGLDSGSRQTKWERIYISTLFTFRWKETVKTINYYKDSVYSPEDVIVGGVMATLMEDEIIKETNAKVISGLLDKPGMLDKDDRTIIDGLIPDYQMLEDIDYEYALKDSYMGYATRGCTNRCKFCAVSIIEPEFNGYLSLKRQVKGIEEVYGPKQNLILLDNNILASNEYEQIINDILELGFHKGAKLNNRQRSVDFNQGLDARKLTKKKMALLAKTSIKPLRLAFDFIALKDKYISKIKLAQDYGVLNLSNYVLYNYTDTPDDFYERLKINVDLNDEIGTKIYSFPMKYIPLNAKDRSYVSPNWNKKILRGIQCILLATKGKVSPRKEFFHAAFGKSPKDFIRLTLMPDDYIIFREKYKNNGADDWRGLYKKLSNNQKSVMLEILNKGKPSKPDLSGMARSNLKNIMEHYIVNPVD